MAGLSIWHVLIFAIVVIFIVWHIETEKSG
jgi:hypothetical protein